MLLVGGDGRGRGIRKAHAIDLVAASSPVVVPQEQAGHWPLICQKNKMCQCDDLRRGVTRLIHQLTRVAMESLVHIQT